MKNLIPYEAINEAAKPLPDMPAFLKAAGAKEKTLQLGGLMLTNQPPNAWGWEVQSPTVDKKWEINFWPNGSFITFITPKDAKGPFTTEGKWKADPSSTFKMGKTTIKGVAMTITTLMSPSTYM